MPAPVPSPPDDLERQPDDKPAKKGETFDPHIVKLKHPIEWGEGNLITELRFKKPKAKDLRKLNITNMTFGDMLDLIATLTNQPKSLIGELDTKEDLERVMTVVGDFL